MSYDQDRGGDWSVWPVVLALCIGPLSPARSQAQDCAVACLATLLSILAGPLGDQQAAAELAKTGEPPYSLLSIKQAAASHGIELEGRSCTLEEALAHDAPVVLALTAPDHFVVVLNQDGRSLHVADGNQLSVPAPETLRTRFRGIALFPVARRPHGPRVALEETHHDAGVVGVGRRLVHSFAMRNVGAQPLTIQLDLTPCCGVSAALDATEVAPGGTAHLAMGVQVASFGPFLNTIRVRTSDPNRRLVLFTLSARTAPGLVVAPRRVDLLCDNLPGGQDRKVLVTLSGAGTAKPRAATAEAAPAVARIVNQSEAHERWGCQIEVRPSPGTPPGVYTGQLVIRMERGGPTTDMRLPIKLTVRPNTIVWPALAFFGFVEPAQWAEQTLSVRCRSGTPFTVKSATLDAPGLSVGEPVQVAPSEWKLSVTLMADHPGIIDTKLVLTTDVRGEETLEIPVYAHILAEE